MAIPKETIWSIDPHTKAKHEILRRYLQAWFPILNKYNHRIVYIDGFCGPGRYEGKEPGSPLIALDVAINHRSKMQGELVFWFIDERKDRIDHLKNELQSLQIPAHFKLEIQCGKFHECLEHVLNRLEAQKDMLAPTFAFIDPFGFSGIPLVLIKRLLQHKRCEAMITFMVDAINRFLENPEEVIVRHIVDAFGTNQAIDIAKAPGDRITNLRILYQKQLQGIARYVRYFEMRDKNNRVQYYLFFASNNDLGHLKMKESMWRMDPEGEFRFSDATDPNQLVLFEIDPTPGLCESLRNEFTEKGLVLCQNVREYTENKTPYLKKHMTLSLKQEETAGNVVFEAMKADGQKRRAGTYPDLVQLQWVSK